MEGIFHWVPHVGRGGVAGIFDNIPEIYSKIEIFSFYIYLFLK